MYKVMELTIPATARVYNSEQGKDFEEQVEVTLKPDPESVGDTWKITEIRSINSLETFWP